MEWISDFVFEEAKMDYITNSKGFPSTRCTKEKQKQCRNNIYKRETVHKTAKQK